MFSGIAFLLLNTDVEIVMIDLLYNLWFHCEQETIQLVPFVLIPFLCPVKGKQNQFPLEILDLESGLMPKNQKKDIKLLLLR